VGVSSELEGGARGLLADHVTGPPACEPHKVGLLPACREPAVGHRVPELVRVDGRDIGVETAALDHLPDSGVGHRTFPAEP
jgi:hypothetical protein